MQFSILGPLSVTYAGHSVTPSSPKLRQLVAFLAVNANRPVSVEACMEELWEDRPPTTAKSTLQSHVLHLRRIFAGVPDIETLAGAHRFLRTTSGGYLLSAEAGGVDVEVFDQHMARAHAAQARGEDRLVSAAYADALAVWRGPALTDVQCGPLLQAHTTLLGERRLYAHEQRIEADLRLARHHELLVELSFLTAEHPMNENLHRQRMVALHRAGRTADALSVYHRLRRVLDDELGIEPSPRLRRLHTSVLTGEPSLEPALPSPSYQS
ncbi:BTAD domain-containing putative transcriptional regulator [Streptomyces sp. NPDC002779]|uniref:AfsR/SARP family transcriptional regulator n=1 Tax=Streptomyces sp. NPDC002779 TaxID=3364664 RepID=UPI0036BE7E0E